MAITRSTNHDSVPALGLIEDLVIGCQTIQKGVAQLLPGNRNKISLRRFYATGDNITARSSTFGTPVDAMTKDEKQILLSELELVDQFDPVDFNLDWPDLWTPSTMGNPNVAPPLNTAIRSVISKNFNNTLDKMLWQGDTDGSTGGSLDLMDGYEKIIGADGTVISVTPAGAVTVANVKDVLEAVIAATPTEVKELSMPTIVTTPEIKYLWREYQRSDSFYKGVNFDATGFDSIGGYKIVSVNGISANRIFMYNIGGDGAELKIGLWEDSDRFNIEFGKGHQLDDVVGLRIRCDVGVQTVYGKQITEYSPA